MTRTRNTPGRYAFSTYKSIDRCVEAGPGRYSLGDNLYLDVAKGGSTSWVFQYRLDGKQREFSLGPTRFVEKRVAVAAATDYFFALKRHKVDPRVLHHGRMAMPANINMNPVIAAQPALFAEAVVAAPVATGWEPIFDGINTFRDVCTRLAAKLKAEEGWKVNNGKCENELRWTKSVEAVAPTLLDMHPLQLTFSVVEHELIAVWKERHMQKNFGDTVKRLRAGWEHAKALNPALFEGRQNPFDLTVLGDRHGRLYRKADAISHAALDADEAPALTAALRAEISKPVGRAKLKPIRAAATLFAKLNANRAAEAIEISDDEVNLDTGRWTLPPHRMKAGEEHTMILSKQALAILKSVPRVEGNKYFFAGEKAGKPINGGSLLQAVRDLGYSADVATAHGMRSTFRDWAGELGFPDELLEFQLAHVSGDATKAAYRRKRAIQLRAMVMQAYADYCFSGKQVEATNVLPILEIRQLLRA